MGPLKHHWCTVKTSAGDIERSGYKKITCSLFCDALNKSQKDGWGALDWKPTKDHGIYKNKDVYTMWDSDTALEEGPYYAALPQMKVLNKIKTIMRESYDGPIPEDFDEELEEWYVQRPIDEENLIERIPLLTNEAQEKLKRLNEKHAQDFAPWNADLTQIRN